jgi:hypothetical protein
VRASELDPGILDGLPGFDRFMIQNTMAI